MKEALIHEAEWRTTRDFVDRDGTVTEVWRKYVVVTTLLPEYH